jgi:hypothetical protein
VHDASAATNVSSSRPGSRARDFDTITNSSNGSTTDSVNTNTRRPRRSMQDDTTGSSNTTSTNASAINSSGVPNNPSDVSANTITPRLPSAGRRSRRNLLEEEGASDISSNTSNVTKYEDSATETPSRNSTSAPRRHRPRVNISDSFQAPQESIITIRSNNPIISNSNNNSNTTTPTSTISTSAKESALRRSLEAVSFAEHHNFNRLPPPANAIIPEEVHEADEEVADETVDRQASTIPTNIPTGIAGTNSTSNLLQRRAERISDVHQKVTTVLSDLADILSTIPTKYNIGKSTNTSSTSSISSSTSTIPTTVPVSNIITSSSATNIQSNVINPTTNPTNTTSSLPQGRRLRIDVYSTWGDQSYLGLNGIEIYDQHFHCIPYLTGGSSGINSNTSIASIEAYPRDLSVLPGYESDPRKLENVLDSINNTKDDLHQWLAPQIHILEAYNSSNSNKYPTPSFMSTIPSSEREHLLGSVQISFSQTVKLTALRIFNFNKSRTHNQRGVRACRIYLDDALVFDG